jgi:CRP-like cAMP-binding protein
MYAQIATKEAAKFPGFAQARHGADQKTVTFLKSISTLQKLKGGQTLFAEGDDADTVFEIAQGIMKLYKLLPDGRRQIPTSIPPRRSPMSA